MEHIFYLLLLILLYIYTGYPLVLGLLCLFKRRPASKRPVLYTVSLIIPAYNEESVIESKIENCLSLDYPKEKLEIIVGSDGSDDTTNSIVKKYQDKGIILSYERDRIGKPAVLARCVKIAKGEIIVFSDADSILEKNSLKALVGNFADLSIGCVEGVRRDINEKGALLDSMYWKYETMLKKMNSKLHSLVGATGAIFAVRKSLYSPINRNRGDDFEIPVRVILQGYGAVLEPEAIAYHPWLSNKDEFGRIARIVSWMMPSAFILLFESLKKKKWLLAFQLISHKILRWLVPIFMISIFIVNLGLKEGIYGLILLMQAFFYLLSIMGYICDKFNSNIPTILKIPYFFCLINFASLAGMIKLVLARSDINWKKTARGEMYSDNKENNGQIRIVIVTQDEPFYLPVFFEDIFSKLNEDIIGISILPEGKSKVEKIKKYVGFYGIWQFCKKSILYALYRLSDIASYVLPIKKLHSVKRISQEYGIHSITTGKINSAEFINRLKGLKVDLIISVASPQIFKKELINTPSMGCINVHGAPLPRYRGMLPSFWMLFNKEKKGAVTVHYIDEGIDSGDIILQKEYDIEPNITHHELIVKSKKIAAEALIEAIGLFKDKRVVRKPNDVRQATYYSFPDRQHLLKFYQVGGRL